MSRNANIHSQTWEALLELSGPEEQEARKKSGEILDDILSDLDDWLVDLGEPTTPDPTPAIENVHFADQTRRIDVSTNARLQVKDLVNLNELYAAEAKLLNEAQEGLVNFQFSAINSNTPEDPGFFPVEEKLTMLQALRERVHALTDESTFETDTVYNSGPSTTHRLLPEKDHECWLQDWFRKRGPPNDEEFEMLQEFLRVDLETLYEWFRERNAQNDAINRVRSTTLKLSKKQEEGLAKGYLASLTQPARTRILVGLREEILEQAGSGEEAQTGGSNENPSGDGEVQDAATGKKDPVIDEAMD